MKLRFIPLWLCMLTLGSCSVSRQINRSAQQTLLQAEALQTAHVGISIFEPAANKYWFNHQGDKYFVPASNTKIPTCYAAMKYLGDSLPGLKVTETQNHLFVQATGDPSLLHEDFNQHPVYDFLKKKLDKTVWFGAAWEARPLGRGWSWDDYNSDYMAERIAFPVYGNVASFSGTGQQLQVIPKAFTGHVAPFSSGKGYVNGITRQYYANTFTYRAEGQNQVVIKVPFITSDSLNLRLFMDSLLSDNNIVPFGYAPPVLTDQEAPKQYVIYSQPTDSVLKPMMHRSDNFFAEQSLLMVSNEVLGVMNDAKIIDTLLQTDFKDLPQKPRWVDGSGLSRYNLFTPQSFVGILHKMQTEFGMDRIREVFPAGNDGTLKNYYVSDSSFVYAKTGTLSGVVALSGFLYTKKNKLLLFSVLVNNHQASATTVRRAIEQFLTNVRNKY